MLKFEFTVDETNTILAFLAKGPFENVAGIINKIQAQAAKQTKTDSFAPPAGE